MPKVSVIIPTYNRRAFIGRALDSVLNQTFKDFETIVVDDGSTDGTEEFLASYGSSIKYIFQSNQGISAARNRGIAESTGEYTAFLDSDDFWVPDKLEEQIKVLDGDAGIGIVYARMPIINGQGERVGTKPCGVSGANFHELLHLWGDIPTSTAMVRRECFQRAGLFDETLTMSEDMEMWIRIARHYKLHEIKDKVLAYYVRHEGQLTRDEIKVYQEQIKTDLKILKIHTEAPRDSITQRIARNEYLTAKCHYIKKDYRKAAGHVWKAFSYWPPLGAVLFSPGDSAARKAVKFIKPLGLLAVCAIKSIQPPLQHEENFLTTKTCIPKSLVTKL